MELAPSPKSQPCAKLPEDTADDEVNETASSTHISETELKPAVGTACTLISFETDSTHPLLDVAVRLTV